MTDSEKMKIIKANYDLQAKVGSGPLDEKVMAACEKVIEENTVDFVPLARQFLDKLEKAIEKRKAGEIPADIALREMANPVMELKANGTTFKYNLISNLASLMLSFLESIKELDGTALEIVEAHHKTLSIILLKKMTGNGGEQGKVLEQELKEAIGRYFKRKS